MFTDWSPEDQGKALAWHLEQKERCQHCGTNAWEWGTEAEPLSLYEADGYVCGGCATLDVEKERRKDGPEAPGVRLVLYPKGMTDGS